MSLSKPIFILGSHKSGSSLLRSLLDGHKSLYVVPTEAHFFQYYGFWVDYRLRYSLPRIMDRQDVIENFVSFIKKKNAHKDEYADSILEDRFDVEKFKELFQQSDFKDPKKCFETYISAIYFALEGSPLPSRKRVVEKSVENAEFAVFLQKMFPDCSFIHIIRNPYASLVAIRKSKTRRRFPTLADYVFSLQNSYYYLLKNLNLLDNYHLIKFEDLVSNPESEMQKICNRIGIEYSEEVSFPTLMGQDWKGNSSNKQSFEKVSNKPVSSWRQSVTDLEIQLVNDYMAPVIDIFGYERLTASMKKYFPVRGELPGTYIKNRMLLSMKPSIQTAP